MRSSSRLLLAFGVAIGVLVIVAIVLVLTMVSKEPSPSLPEDTPEGTVERYLLALENEDYLKAYSYVSPTSDSKITYESWRGSFSTSRERPGWKATLGKSSVLGDAATVDVTIDVFSPSRPFANPVRTQHYTFQLKKEGSSWSITNPVWLWFFY